MLTLDLSLAGPGQPEAEQQGQAEQNGQRAPADGHATTPEETGQLLFSPVLTV